MIGIPMPVRDHTLADRVRRRLREEMAARHITQRDLAGLTGWSQSKIAKILNANVQLLVDDFAAIAWAMDLSYVECVREQGYEFVADLTPTELKALNRLRELGTDERAAILTILGIKLPANADAPRKRRQSP